MEPKESFFKKIKKYLANNTKRRLFLILIGVLVLLILLLSLLSKPTVNSANKSTSKEQSNTIKPPEKTLNLNKDFNFPIKNDKGEEAAKIKYTIESAELRQEILIKGQKASAIDGKVFLIINIKLSNESTQKFVINTRDYIRLSINGNDKELLAPDIHNDPVEVQAISTKETRVGFPINRTDKNLKLRVGEINGNKTTIDLNF